MRLRHSVRRIDGAVFHAGTFLVLRVYSVNRGRETRLALGDERGNVLLPTIRLSDVELS